MFIALSALLVMTLALFIESFRRRDNSHIRGLMIGKNMLVGIIPLLILAFVVAGLVQVAIPPEIIRSWLGDESGWRGIFIGTLVGALITAGPYIAFPIIAAIFHAGAGIGNDHNSTWQP